MARDSLDMSGSDSDSSILNSIPDGSVRLSSNFHGPTIHLLWRTNSHKFEDRIIPLNESVKVGRSVAKLKATSHNAIFDCKVLSRNHALISFKDGKFYIQDTQSSNGTFVNNERLSKGSEESLRKEIFSGDILQFGVDVIENSKKVTHGCIIAQAKLFLADGTEVKADNSNVSMLSCSQSCVLLQALNYAEQREVILKEKIVALQDVIEKIGKAAENSWHAVIDEERLLNKIQALEGQLAALAENNNNAEIKRLISEKEVYESLAKESLSKVLQDKLTALRKCDELQFLQKTTKENVLKMQDANQLLQTQVKDLAEKVDTMTEEAQALVETHRQEKAVLEAKISELQEEATEFQQGFSKLQEEFENMKKKYDSPASEKSLIIEKAASDAEDKISLDSFQGETKSNKEEVIRLEETVAQLKAQQVKVESEKEELLSEVSDLKNLIEKSKADLDGFKEMAVRFQALRRDNELLEAQFIKAHTAAQQSEALLKQENNRLEQQSPDRSLADSTNQPGDAEKQKQIRSLRIELSRLKERFQRCQEEKVEMRKEFEELGREYNGFARQISTMCRNSMIPLFIILVAAMLVSKPFSEIFSSS